VVAAVRDMTERRRALDTLRESEERLRQLAENLKEGLWIVDFTTDRITYANPAFERISGQSRERLYAEKAQMWMELIHPDDRAAVLAAAQDRHKGKDFDQQFRIVRPDGSVRWTSARAFPIKDDSGAVVRAVGIAEDITEQHQFSARQIHVQDEERQRISLDLHDATGPIVTGLLANLALLKESKARLDGKARKALSESMKLAKQCAKEIRTVSYLLHPPLLDELGLASVLQWYVEGFSERSGINVELEIPVDLDRLPSEAEKALFRVVQESLTNIHLHSGSREASVTLTGDGNGYRLEVRDKGKGIPPEQLERPGRGRMGVGIAGMRQRMMQLGGRLELESGPGGTTVRATLPKGPSN
jgi:PAS domain S-box-containing protein